MTRPTVGLLGIACPPSDRELDPELARHHEGYLAQVGRRLATAADIVSGVPATSGEQLAAALAELGRVGVDGCTLLMLGDAPAGGSARALRSLDVPLLLANLQPERAIGDDWSDYDLRFNAGVSAAQALASRLVTDGVRFSALTGDWLSDRFVSAFADWARAAQTLAAITQTPASELLERAAATLLDGSANASLRAMDWNREALLLASSPGFDATPGPLTIATLSCLETGRLRLVVGSGELLLGAGARAHSEHPQLLFAPTAGVEAFMDAWLALGSAPELVIAAGDRRPRWRHLAHMLETEYEEI